MSKLFVFQTCHCAAIDLSFSHYYLINLKSLLLNLRDRHRPYLITVLKVIISDLSKSYSSEYETVRHLIDSERGAMTRLERDPPTGWTDFRLRTDCKNSYGSQLVLPNRYQIVGCLLVMTLTFRYTTF